MSVKLISYDLGVPETSQDYKKLIDAIKELGAYWANPLKSVWLVDNDLGCSKIRDSLKSYLDSNDKLFVIACPINRIGSGCQSPWLSSSDS